jgi:hypothetical protein
MASYNEITGDKIATRTITKDYENNFDRIFRKDKDKVAEPEVTPVEPVEPTQMELDFGDEEAERRMDIIGSNGNIGYEDIE